VELTKEERKWIYEAMQRAGFNPADFAEPAETNDREVSVIHEPSASYFHIGPRDPTYNTRVVKWKVGDGPHEEAHALHWEVNLERWLEDIKRDIATPDPWAELRSMGEIPDAEVVEEDVDTSPFSAEEQVEISRQLDSLRAELEGQLTEAEARILAQQFEYIKDASEDTRRDRWVELFKGVLLGDVVNGQLPSPIVVHILSAAAHFVAGLHGFPQLPPG
jgi:hypothetical protein